MSHESPEELGVELIEQTHPASDSSTELPQMPELNIQHLQPEYVAPASSPAATTHVASDRITVNVQTLSGMLPPIAISSHATVRDLKLRLQTLNADFAFNRQKLIINEPDSEGECEGVVLLNHQTLYSYHMTESTNVVLVMSAKLDVVEVYIDDALKDAERFAALLGDPNLRAMSIKDDIIFRHPTLLLQLFEVNLAVQSIKISGRWTEEHLRFCESLIELRPGIDIRFVVNRSTELKMMLRVAHFCQLNQCSSIQMSNVGLGIEKCRELAPALHSMSSLQHLDLGGNHIVNEGCRALASALQSMSLLQTLDLDNNLIGDSGCSALAIALQSMSSSLQTLNFDANRICVAGCLAMAPALKSMTSLQTLRLRYNSIGDEGCVALAPALKSMPSLKILDLSANYIGASGCRTLAPALQTMSLLQILDLGVNRICAEGCRVLVPALQSMLLLQKLGFSFNRIDEEGCRALALALQSMSSLQTLKLRGNQINDDGGFALATALQSMPSLKLLDLGRNRISSLDSVELAFSLNSLSSLLTVDLGYNQIGD